MTEVELRSNKVSGSIPIDNRLKSALDNLNNIIGKSPADSAIFVHSVSNSGVNANERPSRQSKDKNPKPPSKCELDPSQQSEPLFPDEHYHLP